jgi:cobalt/nickel transport protein
LVKDGSRSTLAFWGAAHLAKCSGKSGITGERKKMVVRLNPLGTILGILAIVILVALPLFLVRDSEFGGSDGAGSELVVQLAPDYASDWIQNLWAPPGPEIESMLFAVQAAVGGALVGYCFGYLRGRRDQLQRMPQAREEG